MNLTKVIALCLGIGVLISCGKDSAPSVKAGPPDSPKVQVTRVVAHKLAMTVHLPGEVQPYEAVAIFPRVTGFVKSFSVDRGSHVRAGDRVAQLEAPELIAQRSEAQSKLQTVRSEEHTSELQSPVHLVCRLL